MGYFSVQRQRYQTPTTAHCRRQHQGHGQSSEEVQNRIRTRLLHVAIHQLKSPLWYSTERNSTALSH